MPHGCKPHSTFLNAWQGEAPILDQALPSYRGGSALHRGVRERTEEDKADAAAFPFDEAAEMASLGAMGPHGEEGFTTLERR